MTITITNQPEGFVLEESPSLHFESPAGSGSLDSGATLISQFAISSSGTFTVCSPQQSTVTAGMRSYKSLAEMDETDQILGDPDTMALLRAADDDFEHGREVRGKLFPKKNT